MKELPIEMFGSHLLRSLDLDPIYVMLHRAVEQKLMCHAQLHQWCVAYWCTYHAGVASLTVDMCDRHGPQYIWNMMNDVAGNFTRQWPRGTERRHFRGANAANLVAGLEQKYPTSSDLVRYLADGMMPNDPIPTTPFPLEKSRWRTFNQISKRAQEHNGFGPWIAFKIADMMERVMGFEVDFHDCLLGVYKDPLEGAKLQYYIWYGEPEYERTPQQKLAIVVERLMEIFGDEYAPPNTGAVHYGHLRTINIQEIETILCKWKSHMNGHYPLGKDTKEVGHALKGWGTLAEAMSTLLPTEVAYE